MTQKTPPRCRNTPPRRHSRDPVTASAARLRAGERAAPGSIATSGDSAETTLLEHALEVLPVDPTNAERLQKRPRDVGWLRMTAGAFGVVMPGVLGLPLLLLGGLIVTPATNRLAARWPGGRAPGVFKGSIGQINRFLDDLEQRYPRPPRR